MKKYDDIKDEFEMYSKLSLPFNEKVNIKNIVDCLLNMDGNDGDNSEDKYT